MISAPIKAASDSIGALSRFITSALRAFISEAVPHSPSPGPAMGGRPTHKPGGKPSPVGATRCGGYERMPRQPLARRARPLLWPHRHQVDFYQSATGRSRQDHLQRGARGFARLVLGAEELGISGCHSGNVGFVALR